MGGDYSDNLALLQTLLQESPAAWDFPSAGVTIVIPDNNWIRLPLLYNSGANFLSCLHAQPFMVCGFVFVFFVTSTGLVPDTERATFSRSFPVFLRLGLCVNYKHKLYFAAKSNIRSRNLSKNHMTICIYTQI